MLELLAWCVFIPATVWNIVIWLVIVYKAANAYPFAVKEDIITVIISLVVWFVPGVYLLGW
jgi:hypothetical protein